MITPEVARTAVLFLDRCQLVGQEAMTFLQVRSALMQIANLQQTPMQPEPDRRQPEPEVQRMPPPMPAMMPPPGRGMDS